MQKLKYELLMYIYVMFRKRMGASQCLDHPWLAKKTITRPLLLDKNKASASSPVVTIAADDKIINTKNLRRFVIRRRWQVNNVHTSKNSIYNIVFFIYVFIKYII